MGLCMWVGDYVSVFVCVCVCVFVLVCEISNIIC